jgi:hypothetical protein
VVREWFNRNFTTEQLIATPAKSPHINLIENAWAQQKIKVFEADLRQ